MYTFALLFLFKGLFADEDKLSPSSFSSHLLVDTISEWIHSLINNVGAATLNCSDNIETDEYAEKAKLFLDSFPLFKPFSYYCNDGPS